MYLPDIYKQFMNQYPDVFSAFEKIGIACRGAGPLSKTNQNLVKLGIAVGANSKGAVMSSTRKALQSGATKEEIMHVVLLSLTTTGFPNMMAAMDWVHGVMKEAATT